MDQYTILAEFYDRLNSEVDYKSWALFLHEIIKNNETVKSNLVLDLACGSGNMTIEMAKLGYDMIGIDLSVDMLMEARNKSTGFDILYLNQDMRDFELYGTVDVVICCLDSVNYLLTENDVRKCFSLVYNYLNPSGIFIFDVNTPQKFENIFADNTFIFDNEDVFCTWQNSYDKESRICEFYLNIFSKNDDGTYKRFEEQQAERMYERHELTEMLSETGFDIINFISEQNERWHFICKSKKM